MRLLVTRPSHDFDALAARLNAKGHEALHAPMLDIVALPFDLPDLAACDGLVFSSANAVRVLVGKPGFQKYTGLQVATVGTATADAARAAGFADIVSAGGDIGELAQLLVKKYPGQGASLVHLAGVERAGDLGSFLGAGGPAIQTIDVYKADAARSFPDQVEAEMRDGEIDGCILMSPRTGAIYASLVISAGLLAPARGLIHYCLSPNVARSLDPLILDGDQIRVASAPELESLLSLV
jgi:uroporphyrinogen-III synthase